jgi:hypothetical protein
MAAKHWEKYLRTNGQKQGEKDLINTYYYYDIVI